MRAQQGTKHFTIVRNGKIRKATVGNHHCGFGKGVYPYRVTLTVKGELSAPNYWVVANEEIDDYVQAVFVRQRTQGSTSCEKMCDDILTCIHELMSAYPQWSTERIRVELTGTNGRALLSCDWSADNARA